MKLLKEILIEKYGQDYQKKLCFWDTCLGQHSITLGTKEEYLQVQTGYDGDITIPYNEEDFADFLVCTIEEARVRGLIIA